MHQTGGLYIDYVKWKKPILKGYYCVIPFINVTEMTKLQTWSTD